jgi:hypothetical protein
MEGSGKQNREFRFEKRWLKQEEFLPRVARIWAQPVRARDSLATFQAKLNLVKKKFERMGCKHPREGHSKEERPHSGIE